MTSGINGILQVRENYALRLSKLRPVSMLKATWEREEESLVGFSLGLFFSQ
jgi:hypothetical protein